jgi:hypothetical protein
MEGFAPLVSQLGATHRLGQAGGADPSVVTPAPGPGISSAQPARLSSITLTPAPMVELIETFFR